MERSRREVGTVPRSVGSLRFLPETGLGSRLARSWRVPVIGSLLPETGSRLPDTGMVCLCAAVSQPKAAGSQTKANDSQPKAETCALKTDMVLGQLSLPVGLPRYILVDFRPKALVPTETLISSCIHGRP